MTDIHPVEAVKSHPWLFGGVVGIILLFFVLRSAGGGGGTSQAVATTDPGADALATAQLQAQTQVAGYQAAATASAAHDQSQIDLATITSSTIDFANQLAAQVKLSEIGASADVANQQTEANRVVSINQIAASDHLNTLNAVVAQGAQSRDVAIANINSNTSIMTTEALTGALTANAHEAAETNRSWIAALPGIVNAQGNAAVGVANANRPAQCTSVLFGLFSSC